MQITSLVRQVIDFCYPGSCALCGEACPDTGRRVLCQACDAKLQELETAPACRRCSKPLAFEDAPCPYCRGKGNRPFDRVVSLGVFEDPLKHLIHLSKYHRRWTLAEDLADRLLQQSRAKDILARAEVLVPVPLHPWRQIARGYNQADLIARQLARRCRLRIASPAVRVRCTETQTHLHSRAKRVQNVRNAFVLVKPKAITGRQIVVVDDVTTTGATLRAFARTLLPARPVRISALVLAVADPRGRGFEQI